MAKKGSSDPAESLLPKTQMVSSAMDALGEDASPSAIQPWIESQYGLQIDKQMISSYASQIRKKRRGITVANDTSAVVRVAGSPDTVSMRDIGVIKGLIDQYGAQNLVSIIKVLSR